MSRYTPKEFAQRIGSGLLSFPVTHFKPSDLSFDEAAYRANLNWLFSHPAAGLFAAGGTGEFFSLTAAETDRVVRAAVAETAGKIPVIAPAGRGTAESIAYCKAAEAAGADGILLLPPYLTEASADGVAAHVEQVCKSTKLGVIVYNRANQVLDENHLERLADRCPNLVGFKDGVGDLELMTRIYARLGDRFTYVGGLPTAETFALPYLTMGVSTYSSAIFNFVPKFAL
ncbi:5-dehydro-4-deoxyglucarate dehydratase, partial [Ralstonia mannitolilytica]